MQAMRRTDDALWSAFRPSRITETALERYCHTGYFHRAECRGLGFFCER